MRQFFSPRFWLTIAALVGLFAVLVVLFQRTTPPTGVQAGTPESQREIDLISWVFLANPAPGFAFDDGVTTADLSLQLDGTRTMMIRSGTPGEIDCPTLTEPGQCTVAADLLGDAVLWFSIIPGRPGTQITLPAVTEMLEGAWVRLANDWVVRRADRVERSCPEDTSSLSDFITTYGDAATSTFNFESQQVVRVTCPDPDAPPATDSLPVSTGPATSVIVGTETDDSTPVGASSTSTTAP